MASTQSKTAISRRFQLPESSDDLDITAAAEQLQILLTRGRLLARKTVETYRDAGRLLQQVKRKLGHGKFTPWVKEHSDLSPRRARELMNLARRWDDIEEWASIAGFDLNGATFEKVMQCFKFKDKPAMRPDDMQGYLLKRDPPMVIADPRVKRQEGVPGAWEQVKGRALPVEWTQPPESDFTATMEEARTTGFGLEKRDQRLRQALGYLAMVETFTSSYVGESFLTEEGQVRLTALMDEIEQQLPETRLLREQGKAHPYRPSSEGLF